MKKLIALVLVAGFLSLVVGCPAATTKPTGTGGSGGTGTGK